MATLPESGIWTPGVYQIETSDPVQGGPDGIDNQQAKDLANRTTYLKEQLEGHLNVDAVDAGTLTVAHGGTGRATLVTGSYLVGAGTGAVGVKTPAEVLSDIKSVGYYTSVPATNVAPVIYVIGQGLMVWAGAAYSVLSASTTEKGLIKLATEAEAKALVDTLLAITPSTLAAVLAAKGYTPHLTFAQIDALTSDQGPIMCSDMPGSPFYTWVSTPYFTGYRSGRCGEMPDVFVDEPRPWELLMTGGVWNINDPKHKRLIAWFRENGKVVTAANWKKGQGMIADLGDGDWKAPNEQDMFFRKSGTDADTANPRLPGSWQDHQFQAHAHSTRYADQGAPGSAVSTPSGGGLAINAAADGGLASGKHGSETRGQNAAVLPVVLV